MSPELTSIIEQLRTGAPHEGRWAPLYYEPMPGSGERITVAILASGADGDARVTPVIRAHALRCLFGDDGEGILRWVEDEAQSMEAALLRAPGVVPATRMTGFHVGTWANARYAELADMIAVGARMSASLSAHDAEQEVGEGNSDAEEVSAWITQVRAVVVDQRDDWAERFNRRVRMPRGRMEQILGYYDGRMAAHFGVVRLMRPSLYHMKPKLWDLAQLTTDLVSTVEHRELIVARPNLDDVTLPLKRRNLVRDVIDELIAEGDNKQVSVIHTHKPEVAGQRILRHGGQ